MILTYTIALAAIAFVLLFFVRAWTNGVLPMYWGLGGIAAGLITGGLIFQILPNLMQLVLPKLTLPLGIYAAVAIGAGLVVYLIIRAILKGILGTVFNAESFLHRFTSGFLGGCLSLLPSIITVFLLGFALRTFGTLLEFRHLEKVTVEDQFYGPSNYPGWPKSAEYRDALERLPLAKPIYNPLDPISQIAKRNLVSLMITRKDLKLSESLTSDPDVAYISAHPEYEALTADAEVKRLLAARKHVALLNYEPLRKSVLDKDFRSSLEALNLQLTVDEYFTSEERAIEKEQRKGNDGFNKLEL